MSSGRRCCFWSEVASGSTYRSPRSLWSGRATMPSGGRGSTTVGRPRKIRSSSPCGGRLSPPHDDGLHVNWIPGGMKRVSRSWAAQASASSDCCAKFLYDVQAPGRPSLRAALRAVLGPATRRGGGAGRPAGTPHPGSTRRNGLASALRCRAGRSFELGATCRDTIRRQQAMGVRLCRCCCGIPDIAC